MDNNYHFNINPEELSDEQIAQHQDFDALLKKHLEQSQAIQNPSPKRANRRIWLYLSGAAAAALLGWFFFQTILYDPGKIDEQFYAEQPFINPPFKNIEASFAAKKINANKGGIYEYDNGSRLIVPEAAFVDDQGVVVEGEVDIKYREFHDYVDFFLSGIPMHYDSAGTRFQLESAGMVEIYAEKEGKRINIAPDKKIDVELVSEIMVPSRERASQPKFNVYHLNTSDRNWDYKGIDDIEVLAVEDPNKGVEPKTEGEKIENNYQEALADLRQQESASLEIVESSLTKPVAPERPQARNGNDYVFNFDFQDLAPVIGIENSATNDLEDQVSNSEDELQKLKQQYEGTLWQVSPNNTDFNQQLVETISWDDMKLRPVNNRDYELTLIAPNMELKVMVNPVLMGADYDKAIQEFNQQFEAYQQKLVDREEALAEQKALLRQRYEQLRQEEKMKFDEKIAAWRAEGKDFLATKEVIRKRIVNRFQATNFGIWNCDRPFPPYIVQVKGEFKDNKDYEYNGYSAFLVDKSRNTVSQFHARKGADVFYNKSADNMMWLVTKENKLALFRPEKFKAINQKAKDHTFVMNVVDKEIKNEEDVRKILEF